MKKLFFILIITMTASCASETEKKGMNEIAQRYDCTVNYKTGFNTNTKDGNFNYIEIDLKDCKVLNEGKLLAFQAASNSALILYKNFSEEEKLKYNKIIIKLNQETDGAKQETSYDVPIDILKLVINDSSCISIFCDALKNNDAQVAYNLFSDSLRVKIPVDTLAQFFSRINESLGKIKDAKLNGFRTDFVTFESTGQKVKVIVYTGIISAEKGIGKINLTVAPEEKEKYIYGFKVY